MHLPRGGSALPEPRDQRERRHLGLLLALTFVTGVVDVVSYVGVDHVFTANMTGNVVLLGAALTSNQRVPVDHIGGAFAGFVLGAALAGRLLGRTAPTGRRRSLVLLGGSGLLLLAMGIVLQTHGAGSVLQITSTTILGFSMGVQGGWARAYAAPDLPTVVVTSTLIGLAFQSRLGSGESTRWPRRAAALLLLVLGGVAGGLLLRLGPLAALGLCTAVVVAVAVVAWIDHRGDPAA
ncbi:DUF1275 family protein [Pseudonocardia acidicola]|uniref:DUF1275 domain-containing protein n=1 Tax=Pseudonocardia acidicola TaxID=2724939 RepID=A0ABX1S9U4_9PSEU|nr:DUF1275 domain-containing protein [Pseudonocardia acidicola]